MKVSKHAMKPVVLVTGCSGFIGTALCASLRKDYQVVGIDRRAGPPCFDASHCGMHFIKTDLLSESATHEALRSAKSAFGSDLASVVHLAAPYCDHLHRFSAAAEKLTVDGTRLLLAGIRRNFSNVEQFVFLSSMTVHEPCRPGETINENSPLETRIGHSRHELRAEKIILQSSPADSNAILRIAGVYNSHCRNLSLANQIARIFENRLTGHIYPGDLESGQALVYIEDLTDAMRSTITCRDRLPPSVTILIGEDETLSYDHLQRLLGYHIHGEADWETARIPFVVAKVGAWMRVRLSKDMKPLNSPWITNLAGSHYALDTGKAARLLGWRNRRSIRRILPEIVRFLKANPRSFYKTNRLDLPPPMDIRSAVGQSGG
ncbi:MAG: NAD(P)-dependent oxidoreductase [Deltaproteobacteria bacterium]|nr:NAD(P)-dependent oxidoreductase [Deltaproteobacteria bacterium]